MYVWYLDSAGMLDQAVRGDLSVAGSLRLALRALRNVVAVLNSAAAARQRVCVSLRSHGLSPPTAMIRYSPDRTRTWLARQTCIFALQSARVARFSGTLTRYTMLVVGHAYAFLGHVGPNPEINICVHAHLACQMTCL